MMLRVVAAAALAVGVDEASAARRVADASAGARGAGADAGLAGRDVGDGGDGARVAATRERGKERSRKRWK